MLLTVYIINATLSSLFFKKNKQSSLDTLLTIGVFGLLVNGTAFGISAAFINDIWAGVSWAMGAVSVIRGTLIVAGLFFVAKAFKLLPVSIMSPLGMILIVPLLLLSWWIFGDTADMVVLILVSAMLGFCVALVAIEGRKKTVGGNGLTSNAQNDNGHGKQIDNTITQGDGSGLDDSENLNLSPCVLNHATTTTRVAQCTTPAATANNQSPTETIQSKNEKTYWRGIIYFAIALSCFLITQVLTRVLADSGQSLFTITFFNAVVIFATVLIVFAFLRKNPIKTLKVNLKSPAQYGIAVTDSLWLFLYIPLVMAMNLGVLNATSRVSTALVVLIGIFLFKEKPHKVSYPIIAAIIGIGIALAFLSS